MRITRISETKRGRFALFDDTGEFLFSVDGETLKKQRLSEGTELSAQQLSAVREASDTRRAKDKALGYVSLRDHSSGELYTKLCQTFDEQTAAAAVAEMRRLDLLDDEAFARHRARYLARQNKSAREIERQLREKGIARSVICEVLEELAPSDDDAAYALVQKSYRNKLRAGEREKVLAALARRGFGYGAARDAIARTLDELSQEAEEWPEDPPDADWE